MSKYNVYIPVYMTQIVEVEANTEEEAIDKALEEADDQLCYECSEHYHWEGINEDKMFVEIED